MKRGGASADRSLVPPAPMRRRLGLLARIVRQADRRLGAVVAGTLVLSAVAGAAQSLALKLIIDAAADGRLAYAGLAAVLGGVAAGLIGSAGRAQTDIEQVLVGQVGLEVDRRTLDLTAGIPGIEHLERPDYLDQVSLVRTGGQSLMRALFALTGMVSLAISMTVGLWLLGAVHPVLLLVPLFAVPTVILVPRSERHVDAAKASAAERQRAATQLHRLFLDPAAAMELRVFGCADQLDERADRLWRDVARTSLGGAVRASLVASAGWATLTFGYVFALLFVARLAVRGEATPGDVVLVSQLALQLRGNMTRTATVARQAAAAFRTTDRFIWLEDLAEHQRGGFDGTLPVPPSLRRGIRLEDVSFTYPGTTAPVLSGIDVQLEAGSTVAIVGENGAGKTSLVKLLAGLYRPTSGRVLADGVDLTLVDVDAWRAQVTATFQDFVRLETVARHSVGVGEPATMDDEELVRAALERSSSSALSDRWPDGLDTHLGKTYLDGVELSGGQWQRVAIARGMMRATPLLRILDEPTAALDPVAEHALYERYSSTARALAHHGAITVLVSHRFSSVRMADRIIVLEHGSVTETGTHEQLVAIGGTYARMFDEQAAAYR